MIKSRKKLPTILLSIGVIGVLVIGLTLALLNTVTEVKNNEFMVFGSEDIDAEIIEAGFDKDKAMMMMPGVPIIKDPLIKNTSLESTMNIWVALKLTFTDGSGTVLSDEDYTKLMTLIEVVYDQTDSYNPKWVSQIGGGINGEIYVYDTVLTTDAQGNSTEVIINEVTLKEGVVAADLDWIKSELQGFNILVEGAAVQASGVEVNEASQALVDLL